MDATQIRSEVSAAYQAYLDAFLADDMAAIDALVRYPLAYIGAGDVRMLESYPVKPAELMAAKEWHHSTDTEFQVVAVSPSKAHVLLPSGKRRRADGSLIEIVSPFFIRKSISTTPDDEIPDGDDETSWRDTLLSTLYKIKPDAFERLAQRILREAGFIKVEVTGKSGDGGIDGMGILRVNLVSFTVLFQCKRYQGSVGAGAIRDFRGAMMGRCDKGLVITTGTFSSDARKEATRDGAPAIDLIDGEALCDLLKSLKLGVDIKLVEEITIHSEWFSRL